MEYAFRLSVDNEQQLISARYSVLEELHDKFDFDITFPRKFRTLSLLGKARRTASLLQCPKRECCSWMWFSGKRIYRSGCFSS